jgi:hypothetical protein
VRIAVLVVVLAVDGLLLLERLQGGRRGLGLDGRLRRLGLAGPGARTSRTIAIRSGGSVQGGTVQVRSANTLGLVGARNCLKSLIKFAST